MSAYWFILSILRLSIPRDKLELYRGKSTKPDQEKNEECKEDDDQEVVFQPVFLKKHQKEATCQPLEAVEDYYEVELPQRYKEIPYSGADILNRANSGPVCHGYK